MREECAWLRDDCEGTATGYGTVLGTLHFRGEPGAKTGALSWRGQGFLENGETIVGTGEGTWEELGSTSGGRGCSSRPPTAAATRRMAGSISRPAP